MPKRIEELGALAVGRIKDPGLHFVGGVAGLALQVSKTGARSWILRYHVDGKRREMGLGPFPDVPLARARELARNNREAISKGLDPVAQRNEERRANAAARAANISLEDAANAYIDAHSPAWKNPKHLAQWRATLNTYVHPHIGNMHVRDIELAHILAVLEPIWTTKTETASRLRGRIESILDWATVRGQRDGMNPARWKGHLDKILPKPSKVARVAHHEALDVSEVGAFMEQLRQQQGTGARALEFAILTAARSGEVRGATWNEIDLESKVWIVPSDRMKAGKEHRVPLSEQVIRILKDLPRVAGTDLVFPAPRGGKLSDMTLSAVVRRMEAPCVPHGFRSTFRDWVSEHTSYPGDMAEMALAHTISSKVEAAYRRGDMFEKRRRMMEDWAGFCSTAKKKGSVVPLKKSAR